MIGGHMIKAWSSTQPVIALSSGDAELYAFVKAAAQAKGLCSLLADYGYATSIAIHTDSAAAICILSRWNLGKTMHIGTQYLWIQQSVHREQITVMKFWTQDNPADVFTKGPPQKACRPARRVSRRIYMP